MQNAGKFKFTIPKKKTKESEAQQGNSVPKPVVTWNCDKSSPDVRKLEEYFNNENNFHDKSLKFRIENLKCIKNPYLQFRFDNHKKVLKRSNQSDQETLIFMQIGFDQEEIDHIAMNGVPIGTSYVNDLGVSEQGVYAYTKIDLVNPQPFFECHHPEVPVRILVCKALKGKSNQVGLGSFEQEPTPGYSSHVPPPMPIAHAHRLPKLTYYRHAAIFFYELDDHLSPVPSPSSILPIGVADLIPYKDRKSKERLPKIFISPDLYGGALSIMGHNFSQMSIYSTSEGTIWKAVGIDPLLKFENLVHWSAAKSHRPFDALLDTQIGKLATTKELELPYSLPDFTGARKPSGYVTHYILQIPRSHPQARDFADVCEAMRLEQKMGVACTSEASRVFLIPTGEFTARMGLPWLKEPTLHIIYYSPFNSCYGELDDLQYDRNTKSDYARRPNHTEFVKGKSEIIGNIFANLFTEISQHNEIWRKLNPGVYAPINLDRRDVENWDEAPPQLQMSPPRRPSPLPMDISNSPPPPMSDSVSSMNHAHFSPPGGHQMNRAPHVSTSALDPRLKSSTQGGPRKVSFDPRLIRPPSGSSPPPGPAKPIIKSGQKPVTRVNFTDLFKNLNESVNLAPIDLPGVGNDTNKAAKSASSITPSPIPGDPRSMFLANRASQQSTSAVQKKKKLSELPLPNLGTKKDEYDPASVEFSDAENELEDMDVDYAAPSPEEPDVEADNIVLTLPEEDDSDDDLVPDPSLRKNKIKTPTPPPQPEEPAHSSVVESEITKEVTEEQSKENTMKTVLDVVVGDVATKTYDCSNLSAFLSNFTRPVQPVTEAKIELKESPKAVDDMKGPDSPEEPDELDAPASPTHDVPASPGEPDEKASTAGETRFIPLDGGDTDWRFPSTAAASDTQGRRRRFDTHSTVAQSRQEKPFGFSGDIDLRRGGVPPTGAFGNGQSPIVSKQNVQSLSDSTTSQQEVLNKLNAHAFNIGNDTPLTDAQRLVERLKKSELIKSTPDVKSNPTIADVNATLNKALKTPYGEPTKQEEIHYKQQILRTLVKSLNIQPGVVHHPTTNVPPMTNTGGDVDLRTPDSPLLPGTVRSKVSSVENQSFFPRGVWGGGSNENHPRPVPPVHIPTTPQSVPPPNLINIKSPTFLPGTIPNARGSGLKSEAAHGGYDMYDQKKRDSGHQPETLSTPPGRKTSSNSFITGQQKPSVSEILHRESLSDGSAGLPLNRKLRRQMVRGEIMSASANSSLDRKDLNDDWDSPQSPPIEDNPLVGGSSSGKYDIGSDKKITDDDKDDLLREDLEEGEISDDEEITDEKELSKEDIDIRQLEPVGDRDDRLLPNNNFASHQHTPPAFGRPVVPGPPGGLWNPSQRPVPNTAYGGFQRPAPAIHPPAHIGGRFNPGLMPPHIPSPGMYGGYGAGRPFPQSTNAMVTIIVPDGMIFNTINLKADLLERILEKIYLLKVVHNETVIMHVHQHVMNNIMQKIHDLGEDPRRHEFVLFHQLLENYKTKHAVRELGVHACDHAATREGDVVINCLRTIRNGQRGQTQLIYMSNMSPQSEVGKILTSENICLMNARQVAQRIGVDLSIGEGKKV